ncbi:MAG: hypothetical protein ACKOA8_15355 [Deltaproteobacteria bacterium]
MKLFGQYLVEKGIVDESELVSALIQQIRQIPTVAEIVHEERLLTPSQILSVLAMQTRLEIDFVKACQNLGLWTPALEKKIADVSAEKRIPLGQILVTSGKVSFQKIVNALDEYLALVRESEKNPSQDEAPVQSQSPGKTIPEDLLKNFDELLSAERIHAIDGLFSLCLEVVSKPDSGAECLEVVRQIHRGIHEIRSIARFVKAEKTEILTEKLESSLAELLSVDPSALQQPAIELFVDLGKSALKMTLGLKESLITTQSEEGFWIGESSKIEKCMEDLGNLRTIFSQTQKAPSEVLTEAA